MSNTADTPVKMFTISLKATVETIIYLACGSIILLSAIVVYGAIFSITGTLLEFAFSVVSHPEFVTFATAGSATLIGFNASLRMEPGWPKYERSEGPEQSGKVWFETLAVSVRAVYELSVLIVAVVGGFALFGFVPIVGIIWAVGYPVVDKYAVFTEDSLTLGFILAAFIVAVPIWPSLAVAYVLENLGLIASLPRKIFSSNMMISAIKFDPSKVINHFRGLRKRSI